MKKQFILTVFALMACFASFAQAPAITGTFGTCIGSSTTLHDSVTGGLWSTSNAAIASVNSTTGVVYGMSAGSVTISYTVALATVTTTFTVSPAPAAITGTLTVCPSAVTTLADATSGGYWSSMNTSVATADSLTGAFTGIWSGSGTMVRYTTGVGCYVSAYLQVLSGGAAPISGPTTICPGSSITLHDTTSGGTWTSSNTSIATLSYTGVSGSTATVLGVATGSVTISYSVTTSCGTFVATYPVSVTSVTPTPMPITGLTTVVAGSVIGLHDTTTGGTWSISPTTVATINATTGVVTGVAAGTANVTYTVSGCGSSASVYYTVTVTAYDGISGTINFGSGAYSGPVKVWLITYVSPMLTAIDSTVVYASGTSVGYHFTGEPTDSFRIKAAVNDSTGFGPSTGYIPTYHTSSFYWNTANVLAHISGNNDINQDINMAYGVITSGPGFIGGNVTTGANKGTASGVPVKNLMMYVINSTTSQLIQAVRTDASGNYSFSNLPVGATYYVFPDSLNYLTTPCTGISLTTSTPSVTSASFIQHTLSHTITPVPVGVGNVSASTASILTFPNPTNGKVNIAWSLPSAQEAAVVVCDITGREVYHTTVNMNEGAGSFAADLSSLTSGLYTISVKSAAINYNNKIQIQY